MSTIADMRLSMNASRVVRRALFAGALALSSSACAPNEVSFFIQQAQVPQATGMGGQCVVTPDQQALHDEEGVMDLALTNEYWMTPLYRNQLIGFSDSTALRAETRGIFVEGAEIRVYDGQPPDPNVGMPPAGLGARTFYTHTFIPAGSAQGVGFAVGSLQLINAQVGEALRARFCSVDYRGRPECRPLLSSPSPPQRVVVTVRPFGRTQGGIRVDGGEFRFGVTLCCGCLLSYPAAANAAEMTYPGPDCNEGMPATSSCNIGQDTTVDCRQCSGSNPLCQPPGWQPRGVAMPCP